ncbi:cytokine-dependent hematopoietic cell linker-like [Copidosoma floridanum]|uniref:cytokine-dependent hematopoietic cell linker-like n=1 Tax=Copidosoma floridanum TaxID=29053 RepID=UPI0006C9D16A|nr:cytokine-dependent hematopoietic cell linker-like [Copidosoma floridanum]
MEQHKTDGCFLLRPSTTNPDNPMTLVLWFKDKVYNIPVRRRPDNKYALGTPKSEEQAFDSIDDIVPHFKSESLILFSGGVEMGCTMLTDTPSK